MTIGAVVLLCVPILYMSFGMGGAEKKSAAKILSKKEEKTETKSERRVEEKKSEMKSEEQLLLDLIRRYAVTSGHERVFAMDGIVHGPGGSVADIPEDELMKGFGE